MIPGLILMPPSLSVSLMTATVLFVCITQFWFYNVFHSLYLAQSMSILQMLLPLICLISQRREPTHQNREQEKLPGPSDLLRSTSDV